MGERAPPRVLLWPRLPWWLQAGFRSWTAFKDETMLSQGQGKPCLPRGPACLPKPSLQGPFPVWAPGPRGSGLRSEVSTLSKREKGACAGRSPWHPGRPCRGEGICRSSGDVWLSHFAVPLKLAQYYKSTILPFKKIEYRRISWITTRGLGVPTLCSQEFVYNFIVGLLYLGFPIYKFKQCVIL